MVKGKLEAGTIVLNFEGVQDLPAWGIILPKREFVKRFEKRIGASWPVGQEVTNENYSAFFKKWGYYLPLDRSFTQPPIAGAPYTVLSSEVLNSEASHSAGVWYMGGLWNHDRKEEVDFVVEHAPRLRTFSPEQLPGVIGVRAATLRETGTTSRRFPIDQSFPLQILSDYFSGKYLGKDLGEEPIRARDIVNTLRESALEEGIIKNG